MKSLWLADYQPQDWASSHRRHAWRKTVPSGIMIPERENAKDFPFYGCCPPKFWLGKKKPTWLLQRNSQLMKKVSCWFLWSLISWNKPDVLAPLINVMKMFLSLLADPGAGEGDALPAGLPEVLWVNAQCKWGVKRVTCGQTAITPVTSCLSKPLNFPKFIIAFRSTLSPPGYWFSLICLGLTHQPFQSHSTLTEVTRTCAAWLRRRVWHLC